MFDFDEAIRRAAKQAAEEAARIEQQKVDSAANSKAAEEQDRQKRELLVDYGRRLTKANQSITKFRPEITVRHWLTGKEQIRWGPEESGWFVGFEAHHSSERARYSDYYQLYILTRQGNLLFPYEETKGEFFVTTALVGRSWNVSVLPATAEALGEMLASDFARRTTFSEYSGFVSDPLAPKRRSADPFEMRR